MRNRAIKTTCKELWLLGQEPQEGKLCRRIRRIVAARSPKGRIAVMLYLIMQIEVIRHRLDATSQQRNPPRNTVQVIMRRRRP
jgi:hypothetical protein